MTLMFMAMLVMFHYRAAMNAFLNVKPFQMPIDSYEDVITSDMDLIVQKGLFTEQVFMFAPEGSLFREIFNQKLNGKKRFHDYGDFEGVMDAVKSGDAMFYYNLLGVMKRNDYPCEILDVKEVR